MLQLVFEDEPEEIAVRLERVVVVEVRALKVFEDAAPNTLEIVLHLAARREVLRLLARRADGVEDALVTRVGRGQTLRLLQQPVGLEDADVREVPDDGPVAEAGALSQLAFVCEVEDAERLRARLFKRARELFGVWVHAFSVYAAEVRR